MDRVKAATEKNKVFNYELLILVFSFSFLFIFSLCGCSSITSPYTLSSKQEPAYDPNLYESYNNVKLKQSGALNVLPIIHKSNSELLSQSRRVIASSGKSESGYKTWFNMVAFDENRLTAKRKYLFYVDEKYKRGTSKIKRLFAEPKQGLMFNCQMVLDKATLNRTYSSENIAQIGILKQSLSNIRNDIAELNEGTNELGSDNKNLAISGLLINQAYSAILYTLDNSPAQATMLAEKSGVEFDHMSFGKGKIRMSAEDDVVTIKIRLGSFVDTPEENESSLTAEEVIHAN